MVKASTLKTLIQNVTKVLLSFTVVTSIVYNPLPTIRLNREDTRRLRTEVTEKSKTLDLYSVCKQINYKIPHTTPVMKLTPDKVIKHTINAIMLSSKRTNITIKT